MKILALLLLLAPLPAIAENPGFAPSAFIGLSRHGPDQWSLPLRLGVTAVWSHGYTAPFLSPHYALDLRFDSDEVEHVPGLRAGIAFRFDDDADDLLNRSFPLVQIYGLAGLRMGGHRPGALRLGMGASIPVALALTAYAQVPIPNLIELYLDVEQDGTMSTLLAFGLGF
jgi:hypothetical protein